MQRRLVIIVLAGALLVALALWGLRRDRASQQGRASVPEIAFGRDLSGGNAVSGQRVEREWGVVACTVSERWGADPGTLFAVNEAGNAMRSKTSDRTLELTLAEGEWEITWRGATGTGVDDPAAGQAVMRLGTVDVDADEVRRCDIGEGWTITGSVVSRQNRPLPNQEVTGCGGEATTDEFGNFSLTVRRGDCLITAFARDGVLSRPSEPLYFSPFDLPPPHRFEVDDSPVGGVGLGLRSSGDGLVVTTVMEGFSAAEVGIEAGYVITAVDGTDTSGWSVVHGVEKITGRPGSNVRLTVRSPEGRESVHSLVRSRIGGEDEQDTGR